MPAKSKSLQQRIDEDWQKYRCWEDKFSEAIGEIGGKLVNLPCIHNGKRVCETSVKGPIKDTIIYKIRIEDDFERDHTNLSFTITTVPKDPKCLQWCLKKKKKLVTWDTRRGKDILTRFGTPRLPSLVFTGTTGKIASRSSCDDGARFSATTSALRPFMKAVATCKKSC